MGIPYFWYDPAYAGNLISGSSAFSKSSLYMGKLPVHVLLKDWRILSIILLACEMNIIVWVIWTYFGIAFLWDWNENWRFPVLWPLLSFPNCRHNECSTLTASVQFRSVAQLHPTLCDTMDGSTPGFPVHHQLPELTQTHPHLVGDAIQPSHPLLSPSPPAFNFPSFRVFSNESVLHIRWSEYWSFSFSINPSNEYSGLISFRIDWFALLAVQGTL